MAATCGIDWASAWHDVRVCDGAGEPLCERRLVHDEAGSNALLGLLAEIGDDRARHPTRDALAADAGMAPVAVESGKRRTAVFRSGCDHRLRTAFTALADSTRHWQPVAHDHYASARARGHDHPRATRTVGRAWTRVLWRCWHNHQPCNPHPHNALRQRPG